MKIFGLETTGSFTGDISGSVTSTGSFGSVTIGTGAKNTFYGLTIQDDSTAGIALNDTGQGGPYQIAANGSVLYIRYNGDNTKSIFLKNDGNIGIGTTSPASLLHIGDATTDTSVDSTTYLKVAKSGTVRMQLNSTNSGVAALHFGDTADVDIGSIEYTNSSNQFDIYTNASHAITIDSSQKLIASGDISGSATSTGSFGFIEASNILFELDDNGDIMPI